MLFPLALAAVLLLAACGGGGDDCERETHVLPAPSMKPTDPPIMTVECRA